MNCGSDSGESRWPTQKATLQQTWYELVLSTASVCTLAVHLRLSDDETAVYGKNIASAALIAVSMTSVPSLVKGVENISDPVSAPAATATECRQNARTYALTFAGITPPGTQPPPPAATVKAATHAGEAVTS